MSHASLYHFAKALIGVALLAVVIIFSMWGLRRQTRRQRRRWRHRNSVAPSESIDLMATVKPDDGDGA
jgi:hypothetical protein